MSPSLWTATRCLLPPEALLGAVRGFARARGRHRGRHGRLELFSGRGARDVHAATAGGGEMACA